jgi:hypothetical protein
MDGDIEEERAHEVDDGDRLAAGGRDDGQAPAGSAVAEVRRTEDAVARLQHGKEVPVAPDVVARGDDVGPGGEELLGELRREAEPVGRVLAVDDAEVRTDVVREPGETRLDRPAPRRPEDVADEEDLQGVAIEVAGCTSRWTCCPLSCV